MVKETMSNSFQGMGIIKTVARVIVPVKSSKELLIPAGFRMEIGERKASPA